MHFLPRREENRCVAAVETGGKQGSPGALHLDGSEELHALLSRKDRPTAFVVSDDILAVSLKRTCAQLGLSVPEDVSIVAFNNSLFAKLTSPQLTSVEVNSFQLGYEAVSQAFNHTENPNLMAAKIIVPHRLVVRSSCKTLEETSSEE